MEKLKLISVLLALTIICALPSCNKVVDKCEGVTCQNSGSCINGNCACATGFEGTHCETKVNARFTGNYTGNTNCDGDITNEFIVIEASPTQADAIAILINSAHKLTATVNGSNITIPVQNFASGNENYRYSGTGTLTGNALSYTVYILYTSSSPDVAYQCTFNGSK